MVEARDSDATVVAGDVPGERAGSVEDLAARWGGRYVPRADGFVGGFAHAADALGFAAAVRDLGGRAGVHFGPLSLRANPAAHVQRGAPPLEADGLAVAVAQRLRGLAGPGQLLVSADATAAGELPGEEGPAEILDHGWWRLKGAPDPVAVRELVDPEAGPGPPPVDGPKAHRVTRVGDRWAPVRDAPCVLPAQWDPFVGREGVLRELGEALAASRLVSLTGIGGSGKTRVATHFARSARQEFPGGVFFVDLVASRDAASVAAAVGRAVGLTLGAEDPMIQVGRALAARPPCLLILDTFEHLREVGAATVGQWRELAPECALLVTTRQALGLDGEREVVLHPLAREASVALFEARAEAARPGFRLDDAERPEVDELVELLDRLPLAIELAAARVSVLSVRGLRARMAERFRLLRSKAAGDDRQATLRATLDWSWELLSPAEQRTLAQLAVFEGGFADDAVVAVVDGAADPVGLCAALEAKSLVRRVVVGRRALLQTVQAYAAERLDVARGRAAAEKRHARWFGRLGDRALERLDAPEGRAGRDVLVDDLANIEASVRRAAPRGDVVAVSALRAAWAVLERTGPYDRAADLITLVAAMQELPEVLRAQVDHIAGSVARWQGRVEEARNALTKALAGFRRGGHRVREAAVLATRAALEGSGSDLDAAARWAHEAREAYAELGDAAGLGRATRWVAWAAYRRGRWDDAAREYRESLRLLGAANDEYGVSFVLHNFSQLLARMGRLDEAQACAARALEIARRLGSRRDEALALSNLGLVLDQGGASTAGAYFEGALQLHRELGHRPAEAIEMARLGTLHRRCGRLHRARAALEEARRIYLEVGDARGAAIVGGSLGTLALNQGEFREARRWYEAALAQRTSIGDRDGEGHMRHQLGALSAREGRIDEARGHFEAALAIYEEVGNRLPQVHVRGNLGPVLQLSGDPDGARRQVRAALALARELGYRGALAHALEHLGVVELAEGNLEEAEAHLMEALALHRELGHRGAEGNVQCLLGNVYAKRNRGPDAAASWDQGLELLRDAGGKLLLGCRLADRALLEVGLDEARARRALQEAEQLAQPLDTAPESELGWRLQEARRVLGDGRSPR